MPAHKGKKHSLRGAIVGLLKRTPIRKRQVEVEEPTSSAQATWPPLDEAHGLEQSPRPKNDELKHDDPQSNSDEQPPCPKDDEVEDDSSRGRPSSFTPTRERAPTPHPSASKPQSPTEKTVQWASQLEESTPRKKASPILKREKTAKGGEDCDTEEKNEEGENFQEEEAIPKEVPTTDARQQQHSNIPRPKPRGLESSTSTSYLSRLRSQTMIRARASTNPIRQAPERPLSSLRIPKDKDSLFLDKTTIIPSSVSGDDKDQTKADQQVKANISRRRETAQTESAQQKPQPSRGKTSQKYSRNFSYPTCITTGPRSAARQHDQSNITNEKPLPPPTTSFLKAKPRRFASSSSAKSKPASTDDNSASTKASAPSSLTATSTPPQAEPGTSEARSAPANPSTTPSASIPSFESAKTFWNKIDSGNSGNKKRIAPVSVPKPDVASISSKGTTAPKAPKTSQIPKASFNATKTFWAQLEMSDDGSCAAQTPKRQSQKSCHLVDIDSSPFISTPASNLGRE
ncbi:hypothetical protein B0T09DRAFT_407532 [Sordaria sp. MPI-SDFR-AT-0083]|nr:hypothetical protein B0T09DRAFT_407532 [Sordaria sp. MPI-SDFR-AT-0083]